MHGGLRTKGIEKKSLPERPLISVLTVVFNNVKTIEDTIKSVMGQTYDNVEYIIIDGGSTDGTIDIIKKYEGKIDYWVSEPDHGLYDAMNKGIAGSKGEWIHILNSDDYYINDSVLQNVVPYLQEPGKQFYYFAMNLENKGTVTVQKYPFNVLNYLKLFYSAYLPHPTMFIAREQYHTAGVFDIKFKIAADHDLILRLCRCYKPIYVDIPIVLMRGGGLSSLDQTKTFRDFRDVTIKNKFPWLLAYFIFWFKKYKYYLKKYV